MATAPNIFDLRGLPDPLQQQRWTLVIPNMPGGADTRRFQYQCITSSIPGVSNDEVLQASHGIDLRFAGRTLYGGNISCTFFETRDLVIYQGMRNWLEFINNPREGTGNYKADYEATAQLILLDDQISTIKEVHFVGFHPQEVGEANLDGQSSGVVQFSATFRFDLSEIR